MSIQEVRRVSSRRSKAKVTTEVDKLEYYYESHPTKEDLMGESAVHINLTRYIRDVLECSFQQEDWIINLNMEIYQTSEHKEYPLAPDVSVFKGVALSESARLSIRSWRMLLPDRPGPSVVFEISSKETWRSDLEQDKKPTKYKRLGVKEYFAYDPNDPPVWSQEDYRGKRLLGWSYINGQPTKLEPDELGRLWSNELESWLVPDKYYLRLYDRQNQLRLTRAEAECRAKEAERAAKEAERAAKEAAEQREATERAAKEVAWAKLRELGIDPETL
ncbi:MAG: Uma2 family endonuclease [Chloroflexi bacterium]|nr:Uma2 family endonuclease [Chloroflexota bacterium]